MFSFEFFVGLVGFFSPAKQTSSLSKSQNVTGK